MAGPLLVELVLAPNQRMSNSPEEIRCQHPIPTAEVPTVPPKGSLGTMIVPPSSRSAAPLALSPTRPVAFQRNTPPPPSPVQPDEGMRHRFATTADGGFAASSCVGVLFKSPFRVPGGAAPKAVSTTFTATAPRAA